jgi:hypothetical protein
MPRDALHYAGYTEIRWSDVVTRCVPSHSTCPAGVCTRWVQCSHQEFGSVGGTCAFGINRLTYSEKLAP